MSSIDVNTYEFDASVPFANWLVNSLRQMENPNTFNPYSETDPKTDISKADFLRSAILSEITCKACQKVGGLDLWVGRDLGHRGGRRTGMAFTDDLTFHKHLARWDIEAPTPFLDNPMFGPTKEQTATVVWEMLDQISRPVFLWNVFPMHPHEYDRPYTNRRHTRTEWARGMVILEGIVRVLQPVNIICVGNDAYESCRQLRENQVFKVRHPSYGGKREFIDGISTYYNLGEKE